MQYKTNGRGLDQKSIDVLSNNLDMHIHELAKILPDIPIKQIEYYRKRMRKKLGYVVKSSRVKYHLNDNYFSEVTEESAYWAGFIAADGCINKNALIIKISAKDLDHLEKFVLHTEFTGNITHCQETCNGITFPQVKFFATSEKWVYDLKRIYNITERKSKTLMPPNITDVRHIMAFIIGYIDGDGNIGAAGNTILLQVLGTKDVLLWIKHIFDTHIISQNKVSVRVRNNIYRYSLSGSRVKEVVNYTLGTTLPYLKRKWKEQY